MKNDDIAGGLVVGLVAACFIVVGIGCCDCPKPACRCGHSVSSPANEAIKAGCLQQIQNDQKQAIEFRTKMLQREIDTATEMGELQTQIDTLTRRVERVEQAHGIVPEKPAKRRFATEETPEVSPPIGDPTSCGELP